MKLKPKHLIGEIDASKWETERLEDKLLKQEGWEYITSRIDCCWYWTKKIDGTTYYVGRETALRWAEKSFCDKNPKLFEEVN